MKLQCEITVKVGHCRILGVTLLYYGRTNDGFASGIYDRTLSGSLGRNLTAH